MIQEHVINYFQDLFTANDVDRVKIDLINSLIPQLVSEDDNFCLCSIPSNEGVRSVDFSWMHIVPWGWAFY